MWQAATQSPKRHHFYDTELDGLPGQGPVPTTPLPPVSFGNKCIALIEQTVPHHAPSPGKPPYRGLPAARLKAAWQRKVPGNGGKAKEVLDMAPAPRASNTITGVGQSIGSTGQR